MERSAVLRALDSAGALSLSQALVSASVHDPDRAWIETLLERFLVHDDPWVRGIAATCVAHVVRRRRALDMSAIVPLLEKLKSDPATSGKAQDALDDIEVFVGKPH
jgi:hypothetical protein